MTNLENDIEWLKAVLKVRDAQLELCTLERNQARAARHDGAAPDASITDPTKPTKPVVADEDLRGRMDMARQALFARALELSGSASEYERGQRSAYTTAARRIADELSK